MAPALSAAARASSGLLKGQPVASGRVPARLLRLKPVRAEAGGPESAGQPNEAGTVFYGGKAYTPDEWKAVVASGSIAKPEVSAAAATANGSTSSLSFTDVMGFSGTAPEIVNGRLAMLGFVSAVAAEFASGEGVLKQWSEEPTGVALAFLLFIGGSLVTAFKPNRDEKLGPFTPQAELINGRAAMIGFAALLIIEAVKGSPLL